MLEWLDLHFWLCIQPLAFDIRLKWKLERNEWRQITRTGSFNSPHSSSAMEMLQFWIWLRGLCLCVCVRLALLTCGVFLNKVKALNIFNWEFRILSSSWQFNSNVSNKTTSQLCTTISCKWVRQHTKIANEIHNPLCHVIINDS